MSVSDIIYRWTQKWKYHTTTNTFRRKVAEFNRNGPVIHLQKETFNVKGSNLLLDRKNHAFVLDRFDAFEILLRSGGVFRVEGMDLYFILHGIRLRVTTAEELFIIHEIYIENCYSIVVPWQYQVIDIGMNVGYASLFFANNPEVERIYGYEPFRPTFEDAQRNIKLNGHLQKKIHTFNFGLGKSEEELVVSFSNDFKGKSSIHSNHSPSERISLKNAYQILTNICERDSIARLFVKMDCEGAEFDIFEQLSQHPIAPQIFGFIIEYHAKDPQPIIDALKNNDFKIQRRGNSEIGLITAFR